MSNFVFIIFLVVVLIYVLSKIFEKIFSLFRKKKRKSFRRSRKRISFGKYSLSEKARLKADRKFDKLKNQFIKEKGREPNNNESFRIIINTSHITIRRRGFIGHWGRQKVRKYLLEKHNIVDKYKMK